jgi:cytochrome c oxidase subunit 3
MSGSNAYYLPAPSHYPILGSIGLFLLLGGLALTINGIVAGSLGSVVGLGVFIFMLVSWFGKVIRESQAGTYNHQVDMSFRWGMGWFIFSEVMFFVAFFGALYYARAYSVPWLGGEGFKVDTQSVLWPAFKATWPLISLPDPTNFTPAKEAMGAGGIPLYNTFILLSSGGTVTWAHWGLKKGSRGQLIVGLLATVALGSLFLGLQAYEYTHAYTEMSLKLSSGIYGTTFFMLTGFHGLHVTVGTIMLIVITLRSMKGHFTPEHHFGFEAVSWYWHFVDVVWLGLYCFVYWL